MGPPSQSLSRMRRGWSKHSSTTGAPNILRFPCNASRVYYGCIVYTAISFVVYLIPHRHDCRTLILSCAILRGDSGLVRWRRASQPAKIEQPNAGSVHPGDDG